LFQKDDDLYILDQHAVAERIIFEKMRKEYNPQEQTILTMPLTFTINQKIDKKIEKLQKI
jgi:DNA mismatch repair ATPase MutL